ncbi:MAG: hypothetical protein ACE5MB_02290 [Anaerolineae bacterium]
MKKVLSFLGSSLGVVALVVLAGVLVLIFRTRSGGPVALQQATPVPVAPTPGPRVMNFRLSDAPDGPAVANFPSGTSLVYAIFEYAEMEDTPVQLRVFDGKGNVLFEQTNRYRGAGMDSIAVSSATEAFPDDMYVANIYLYMDSDLYPGPFLVDSYEWFVGKPPTPVPVPTRTPRPTQIPPTPPPPPSGPYPTATPLPLEAPPTGTPDIRTPIWIRTLTPAVFTTPTPLPISKITDLVPDLPDEEKSVYIIRRADGTYEKFLISVHYTGDVRTLMGLGPGDVLIFHYPLKPRPSTPMPRPTRGTPTRAPQRP